MKAPQLSGDALAAVKHRGSHMQIIAAAGSGKTEVVSQRVADLIEEGVDPRGIVAFTFTERAAEEMKQRIALRVEERMGAAALDKMVGLYVGTIHAFCFRLLQQRVDCGEKTRPAMAVAGPVVRRQAGGDQRAGSDAIGARPRTLDQAPEADQRHLRGIDDAEDGFDALIAEVGDGDARVGNVHRPR